MIFFYVLSKLNNHYDGKGKSIREDKRDYIEEKSPILEKLGVDSERWLILTTEFEQHFNTVVGGAHLMR